MTSVHSESIPQSDVPPVPCVRLRLETAVVDQSGGYGTALTPIDLPVIELMFDYPGHRISVCDPRDRFLSATSAGLRAIARDTAAERRARTVLESFGAIDLECLDHYALAPDSRAHYVVRCEGDVHDYCSFGAHVVPRLRALGWRVELDASYPYRTVEEEPRWYAEVEDGQRPDWFALELGVEIDGRRVSLLPALIGIIENTSGGTLSALMRHKKHVAVPLPDGRYLAVSPDRLQPILRVVTELYDGDRDPDEGLAFSKVQSAALTSLDEVFVDRALDMKWQGNSEAREIGRRLSEPPAIETPKALRATLRSYQVEGVQWMQHLRSLGVGGILADDMGLGKTLQTIAHITIEKESGRLTRPALVVAPTSLVSGWSREIAKFSPTLRVLVLAGKDRHDRFASVPEHDVVITSYALLVRDEEKLAAHEYHLLILDEAHTIKNARSQSHLAAKRLSAEHRLCVTGTPVENHLGELWALFDFASPGLLGDELAFRRWYRVPIEQHGDEERLDSLRAQVAPYLLRRNKRDVAKELPPKTEIARPVLLGNAQAELYESIRIAAHGDVRKLIAKKGLAASTVPILDALTKLRQVCCDPRLVPLRGARAANESAKLEMLMEMVHAQRERGHRILVFSQFAKMLALISQRFDASKVSHLLLTGASRDRQGLVDAFEGGRADVFLISLKAGGVGLNLVSADMVIHYDPWWNPAAQDQATDRAYRIGQKKPVVATSLYVAGSVEERLLALQQKKRRLADGILGGGAGSLAIDEADVEALFAPLDM
jgi:superfamily II DNA or RNA helicase